MGRKPTGRFAVVGVLVLALTLPLLAVPSAAATPHILNPIGGGYSSETEAVFVQNVIDHATGTAVRILVIPSAYSHTSLGFGPPHVDELQALCQELLPSNGPYSAGCDTELVPLWTRDDAQNPQNVAMIADPETDGLFYLGGDQDAAMEVIAGTLSEQAMAAAFDRGVVVSGTSAGTAVESRTMLEDYANGGDPGNALQQDKVAIWWGDDGDLLRGLSFGSQNTILDQHFDQRGRFTRSLNVAAQSVDHFGGAGTVGVGVDFQTSVRLTDDSVLSNVAGDTAVNIIDFSHASHDWVGPDQTLSARHVLTQIMPPGPYSYDLSTRTTSDNGAALAIPSPAALPTVSAPGTGALMLGGDLLSGGSGLATFVSRARTTSSHRIVVVAAGFFSSGDAGSTGNAYAQALKKLGWSRSGDEIDVLNFEDSTHWAQVKPSDVDGAAGVIIVGGDQSQMARPLADTTFRGLVAEAVSTAPVVLTDRAMTPVMGDWYITNADPTVKNVQSVGIDAFHVDYAGFAAGLGYVHATFEPRLMTDQRWGRLYSLADTHPSEIAYGIGEQTAMLLSGSTAQVAGDRSVIALDGRSATFAEGDNGAIGAFNVYMNLYAPGEALP